MLPQLHGETFAQSAIVMGKDAFGHPVSGACRHYLVRRRRCRLGNNMGAADGEEKVTTQKVPKAESLDADSKRQAAFKREAILRYISAICINNSGPTTDGKGSCSSRMNCEVVLHGRVDRIAGKNN